MLKDLLKSENGEWLSQLCCLDCAMSNFFDKALSDTTKGRYLEDVSGLEVGIIEETEFELDANTVPAKEQVSANEEPVS